MYVLGHDYAIDNHTEILSLDVISGIYFQYHIKVIWPIDTLNLPIGTETCIATCILYCQMIKI